MIFLETNRLRLRNVSPKDAIQMVDYRNNERCSKYQRGQTKDYKDIVALIERNKDNALNIASPTMISVALRETDVMIGEIVVMPNEGTISLGYTFSYKVHRNGYAYEALSSLIEYLHKHYPQWDFICFTERENIPSMSLLKKLGYTNLGYLPSKNSQVFGKWLRQDTLEEITSAVRQLLVYRNLRSRVWGTARPNKKLFQREQEFSTTENLWPRDGSCSHAFTLFALTLSLSLRFSFLKVYRSFVIIKLKEGGHYDFAIFCHSIRYGQ